MSLLNAISSAVDTAFAAISSLLEVCTFVKILTDDTYDPTTGLAEQHEVRYPSIQMLMHSYNEKQVDGVNILPSDIQAVVPRKKLPNVIVMPGDEVIRSDDSVWRVMTVDSDPANTLWMMQIRRSAN